ncbi:MAG: hypothetical protein WKF78_09125 [Candidatus Limnocylindrales bacterium]
MEMLHRGLRVQRQHRVLEFVRAERRDHVGGDQHEQISDRDLASPDVRLQTARWQATLTMGIGQGGEAGLADKVGLGGAHRRHVHLVAAHDGQADPDRAVAIG